MSKFNTIKEIASYLNPVKTGKAAYNAAGKGKKGIVAGLAVGGTEALFEAAAIYAIYHQFKYGYSVGWDDVERLKDVLGYGKDMPIDSSTTTTKLQDAPSTPEVSIKNATDNATSAITSKSAAYTNHTNISASESPFNGSAYIDVAGSKITTGPESHSVEVTADTCRAIGNSSGFVVETGNAPSKFTAGARC